MQMKVLRPRLHFQRNLNPPSATVPSVDTLDFDSLCVREQGRIKSDELGVWLMQRRLV